MSFIKHVHRILLIIVVSVFCMGISYPQDVPKNLEWKQLYPGLEHAHFVTPKPLLNVNVLKVDTSQPGVSFQSTGRCANWEADKSETDRRTVPDALMENGWTAAVNANFYSPFNRETLTTRGPSNEAGLVVADGTLVSPSVPNCPSFIQTKDGKVEIRQVDKEEPVDNISVAVSGYPLFLKDGQTIIITNPEKDARHPRTLVGISSDKRFVYLVTIDGRQAGFSIGANMADCVSILQQLGASDGLNLDGGGSTTMVYRSNDGKPVVLNRPVGQGPPNTLRHNGNALGIRVTTPQP